MATEQHRRKAAAQTGLYLVVLTAIVVLVNVLSAGAYKRIDGYFANSELSSIGRPADEREKALLARYVTELPAS